MPPVMPLDIQWFIYALVSNEALTQGDAQAIYRSLGLRANLEDFAQLVLEQLADGMSDEDALSSIRITFGHQNTLEEINYVCDILLKIIYQLREIS